jgi:hypothetical protein
MGLNHRGSIDSLVASVVEAEEAVEEAAEEAVEEEVKVVEDHLLEVMVGEEDPSHQHCLLLLHCHHLGVVVTIAIAVVVVVGVVDSHLAQNLGHHLVRCQLLLNSLLLLQKVPSPSLCSRGSCLKGMSHMSPFPMPSGFSRHKLYSVH